MWYHVWLGMGQHKDARWRLKSPASRLFTQAFIQAQIKEKNQSPASLAFVWRIHRWPKTCSMQFSFIRMKRFIHSHVDNVNTDHARFRNQESKTKLKSTEEPVDDYGFVHRLLGDSVGSTWHSACCLCVWKKMSVTLLWKLSPRCKHNLFLNGNTAWLQLSAYQPLACGDRVISV